MVALKFVADQYAGHSAAESAEPAPQIVVTNNPTANLPISYTPFTEVEPAGDPSINSASPFPDLDAKYATLEPTTAHNAQQVPPPPLTHAVGDFQPDSNAESAPARAPVAPAPQPLADSPQKTGRKRKFTGPGWDELSKAEYAIKFRKESDRLQNLKRKAAKNGENVLVLPVYSFLNCPHPVNDSVMGLYQIYFNEEQVLKNGIESFIRWLNDQQIRVESARVQYMIKNIHR
jgi:hypothetical protein